MNEFIQSLNPPAPNSLFGQLWAEANFEMALKFFVLYIFVIWIATVVWVVKDITNRTMNLVLQIFAILLVILLPFIGIFLYLLIRPSHTLLERYYQEIEENLNTMSEFITQYVTEKQSDKKKVKKEKKK